MNKRLKINRTLEKYLAIGIIYYLDDNDDLKECRRKKLHETIRNPTSNTVYKGTRSIKGEMFHLFRALKDEFYFSEKPSNQN